MYPQYNDFLIHKIRYLQCCSSKFLLIGFLLTFSLMVGCRSNSFDAQENVLVVGQISEPKSLDPHILTSLNDFRILVNIYDGLVRFKDGTLTVIPGLAESWDISSDGRIYTFDLRKNVKFHDGSRFNAGAVKFNIDRMLRKNHPYHDTGPFPLSSMLEVIDSVEVLDTHKVRFYLDQPHPPLLSHLAYPIGLMVSPAQVMKYKNKFGEHPSGTGPFKFIKWADNNNQIDLEKNPQYWEKNLPKLEGISFLPIRNSVDRIKKLFEGEVDLIVEVPHDHLSTIEQSSDLTIHKGSGPHLWFLILNIKEGPFKDVRMRKAINFAINKIAIVDTLLRGTAEIAAGPVPKSFAWAYNHNLVPYPFDRKKADSLVKAAGYENGVNITFYVTEGGSGMLAPVQMARAIQADLAKVKIFTEIKTFQWNSYLKIVNAGLSGKADMAEMAWMVDDPHTLLSLTLPRDAWPPPDGNGFNSGYYSNEKVDSLLKQAAKTTEDYKRSGIYKKIQSIVYNDCPWVFVASWKLFAVTRDDVKGFSLQPSFLLRLDKVEKH